MADSFLWMHDLAGQFWTLIAIVTGMVVLGILHVLASAARNQLHLHDLRIRVNTLRCQRLEQLRDLAKNQNADIEVVDEFADVEIEEPPSKSRRAA